MNSDKRSRKAEYKFAKLIWILAAFLAFSGVMGYSLYSEIQESIDEQVHTNLDDLAEQNEALFIRDVNAKISALQGFAVIVENSYGENVHELMSKMQEVSNIYHLKRIGLVLPDGSSFTSDGYTRNLSFRPFFKASIEGKIYIQHRFIDSLGVGESVNVISVPVKGVNTQIKGVLFATYKTEDFQNLMEVNVLENKGFCTLINDNGDILTTSKRAAYAADHNLFESLVHNGYGSKFIQELRQNMALKKSGVGHYGRGADKMLVHYQPIKLGEQNWYLLTSVPADVGYEHLKPIVRQFNVYFGGFCAIAICIIAYILYGLVKRRNKLYRLAYTDNLTGEENFPKLKEEFEQQNTKPNYFIVMDVAHFRDLAFDVGEERANTILLDIWQLIKESMKEGELACHEEFDNFVMCLRADNANQLEKRLRELREKVLLLSRKYSVPALNVFFGVDSLNKQSDLDLMKYNTQQTKQTIKRSLTGFVGYHSMAQTAKMDESKKLMEAFPDALEQQRFEAWYQPKFSLENGEVSGAEALVRWRGEDGKMISPGAFISTFERNGVIGELDEYIFKVVCQQQKQWLDEGRSVPPVSVNVSRVSLFYGDVVERYTKIIQEIGLDPQYVGLEVTEGSVADRKEISECMHSFKEAGFTLLLDDFGSGYSSLSSFFSLPINVVKIDKKLIDHLEEDGGYKMIESVVNFAKGIKMDVVTEGVETQTQLQILKRFGYDRIEVQGYVYAKPMCSEEYANLYLNLPKIEG